MILLIAMLIVLTLAPLVLAGRISRWESSE